MRVPNAGQDLVERRIVREGKRIAAAMLADYRDPPDCSVLGLYRMIAGASQALTVALRAATQRL